MAPAALFVTDWDGLPVRILVAIGTIRDTGTFKVRRDVPPGLAGLDVTFRSFALDASGSVLDSADEVVFFR